MSIKFAYNWNVQKGAIFLDIEKASLPKMIRMLSLFERLTKGESIRKAEEAARFGVDAKSIQRDIEDLRVYFQETWASPAVLYYSREERGYRLDRQFQTKLTAPEILVIGKVLLESRCLAQKEMVDLLGKLTNVCEPDTGKQIADILRNEQFHYFPVRQGEKLIPKIWNLSRAVREYYLVEILYRKERKAQPVKRTIEPLGVIYSEYYFYLVANIHGQDYPFPAVYRIDRIEQLNLLQERFKPVYSKRFEEGEFRKRIQFMKPGPLQTIRFRFWGPSPEAALDRFPNGKIVNRTKDAVTIEAEVYGEGVVMWLLSQAEFLEVLQPKSLRDKMQQTIDMMRQNYLPTEF